MYECFAGTLQLDSGLFSSFATLIADPGGTIVYNSPTLAGGILLGAGTHNVSAVSRFQGVTISNGVSITPAAGTVSFFGVTQLQG